MKFHMAVARAVALKDIEQGLAHVDYVHNIHEYAAFVNNKITPGVSASRSFACYFCLATNSFSRVPNRVTPSRILSGFE